MRLATDDDLAYFIQAGRDFCSVVPFGFDPDSYARNTLAAINDPNCIVVVSGEPPEGHSAARLTPSLYDDSELIARVFTTWGKGGLKCFAKVEELCAERGAAFLVADALVEPRISRYYERRGMTPVDQLFIKEL